MTEYDDEFGEPLPHSSADIAKDIATANGFAWLWESYHPVVRATVDWLADHGYLTTEETPPRTDSGGHR